MSRWDKKDITISKEQFRNYLALFSGVGIIIGYCISWALC